MDARARADARRVDHLFDLTEARFDRWREPLKACQRWVAARSTGDAEALKVTCAASVEELRPVEDFHAFPGPRPLATDIPPAQNRKPETLS